MSHPLHDPLPDTLRCVQTKSRLGSSSRSIARIGCMGKTRGRYDERPFYTLGDWIKL